MRFVLAAALWLAVSPAFAQATDQVVFLSKALAALQQQRNDAMDSAVNAQTRAAILQDQVADLQQRLAKATADIEAMKAQKEQQP